MSEANKPAFAIAFVERFERLTGINPCVCPTCKKGKMVAIRVLPRIRSPDMWLQNQSPVLT